MNWARIGGIVGGLLFVVLIVVIAIGPDSTCSSRPFPFLCLVKQLFTQ